ncbi:MAG: hypothetical protein ACT4TC_08790 [Myxococcaceae bacterium]
MDVIEKILSLRPTNAVSRLGPTSRLPILNPRDLSRALGSTPLLCLPVPELSMLPGLLRAARELDAVLGLASPSSPVDKDAPSRFVEALRSASDDVGPEPPHFIQAGPVRLVGSDERSLDQAKDQIFRYVDAGFSLISLDGSRLALEEHQSVCRELCAAVVERELSLEVAAPRFASGKTNPEALDAFLSHLAQAHVYPNHVRVEAMGAEGRVLDEELVKSLAETAATYNVALTLEDVGVGSLSSLSHWGRMGVRKVDAVDVLGQVAAKALPEELRDVLGQKAQAAGVPLGEVLAQSDQFFRGVTDGARERLEAMSFAQSLDLLEALGAEHSARRCMAFLAEQAGY